MSEYLGGNYKDFSEAVEREIKMRDDKLRGDMFLPLDIDNLPDKFFTREDIEIEVYYTGDWGYKENRNKWIKNADSKTEVVKLILETTNLKYRYRIIEKKLEPMIVTPEIFTDMCKKSHGRWERVLNGKKYDNYFDGREVIIIE